MAEICRGQQQNQQLLQQLERRVAERTHQLEAEVQERIRTARELELGEAQRRQLVATLPIGIFETTRSGKVLFANPYLVGLIGLPANFDFRMLAMNDGQIFPHDDRERFWSKLETDGEVRGFAATFRHFDGSPFEVVINARVKNKAAEGELVCEGTLEDVSVRKRAERELDALHSQLLIASRQAGMAEVATGVLHNVGNVLTSVNLIVHDVQDRLKTTRLTHLRRVVEILQREQPRLAEFLTADNAGRQLPDFLAKLDEHLTGENRQLLTDVEGLVRHFEHIREIIVTQQGSAQLFGVLENLNPAQLFEDALRLNAESLERHGVTLERVFDPVGMVKADRHKVLQILVNLLKNAKDALQVLKPGERRIRVSVTAAPEGLIALRVEDNGPGIAAANLRRIFQHGFTTKQSGHGFGLHSSVLAAREMDGDLVAESAGPGKGATFILSLPAARTPAP
jgi:PAS domain S-box-containing protein